MMISIILFIAVLAILSIAVAWVLQPAARQELPSRTKVFAWIGIALVLIFGFYPVFWGDNWLWFSSYGMERELMENRAVIHDMYIILPLVYFVAYLRDAKWFKPVALGCMSLMILFFVEFYYVYGLYFSQGVLSNVSFWFILCECVVTIPLIVCRNCQTVNGVK